MGTEAENPIDPSRGQVGVRTLVPSAQLGHGSVKDYPTSPPPPPPHGCPGLLTASVLRRVITSLILWGGGGGKKGSTDKFIYLSRNGSAERARLGSRLHSHSLTYHV